ncbi:MAG TPA: NADH dehydrogenase subunit D, partial [Ornithinibacter sp.]|nr:NADH dehydrogenase subunit D [Ornithinibacter sp.]
MTTHDHDTEVFEDQGTHESFSDAYGASVDEGLDGAPVFNVSGGDWNDLVDEATALHEERIVVNMGPQHPSTHGVLRLILELDG